MDHAKAGAAALEAKNPSAALSAYTKALIEHPSSPDYFIQRSTAFTRLTPPRHDLALRDAEIAVLYAYQRAKRASIHAAQHRRAVCLYHLGQYADAEQLLEWMRSKLPGEDKKGQMQIDMWYAKIINKLKNSDQDKTVSISEKPTIELPDEKGRINNLKRQLKSDGSYNFEWESEVETSPILRASETSTVPSSTPVAPTTSAVVASKIRHEWYQNAESVIITLYAKGVRKDKAEVDIQDSEVSVSFPHPADPSTDFSFSLDPLFALIDPAGSSYRVLSTKIEITLKKTQVGQKWSALEGTEAPKPSSDTAIKQVTLPAVKNDTTKAPTYPTSSKTGPKNWDKLAADMTKKKSSKAKDKTNVDDDESDDAMQVDSDEEGGDAVDSFFKRLYKGADDDTKRAMMKSFQESNGTSLSTNWAEVGKKFVAPVESKQDEG